MLKFLISDRSDDPQQRVLRNAYMMDSDHAAIRAELFFDQNLLLCRKRETGAASFASLYEVGECGQLTLQTCLLPDRDEPYLLALELVRHRIMLIYNKMEEWGMFDLPENHSVTRRFERARRLFIDAICVRHSNAMEADRLAKDALVCAIDGSEELALAHAEILLSRRRATGNLPRFPIGSGVALNQVHERIRTSLTSNFDFVCLPLPWRKLCASASEYDWTRTDEWVEWASRMRLPVIGGPLISFDPNTLPDWVYIWQHDFEHMRDLVYEHIERVVARYRNVIQSWTVLSGLHVNEHMPFNLEQVLDLTRTAAMLVKRLAPQSRVIVELVQPFGEYSATNPRSIPPVMYVEQLIQNNMPMDALGLRLAVGHAVSGQYARDLMQISHLLDQYASYGKPLHLSVAAPSDTITSMMIQSPDGQTPADAQGGFWRRPWSSQVQGRWLEAIFTIAMSKPLVESVSWQEFIDHPESEVPLCGLVSEALQPKPAFKRLVSFRQRLTGRASWPQTSPTADRVPGPSEGDQGSGPPSSPITGQPIDPIVAQQAHAPEEDGADSALRHVTDASDPPITLPDKASTKHHGKRP
ncbi:MAG: endo-1,4-beta-xylanase [Phycisphaeraceae bacterium]|nr:endo-1,4-beta-xylanase [Phycisphaeraceae bacterium]